MTKILVEVTFTGYPAEGLRATIDYPEPFVDFVTLNIDHRDGKGHRLEVPVVFDRAIVNGSPWGHIITKFTELQEPPVVLGGFTPDRAQVIETIKAWAAATPADVKAEIRKARKEQKRASYTKAQLLRHNERLRGEIRRLADAQAAQRKFMEDLHKSVREGWRQRDQLSAALAKRQGRPCHPAVLPDNGGIYPPPPRRAGMLSSPCRINERGAQVPIQVYPVAGADTATGAQSILQSNALESAMREIMAREVKHIGGAQVPIQVYFDRPYWHLNNGDKIRKDQIRVFQCLDGGIAVVRSYNPVNDRFQLTRVVGTDGWDLCDMTAAALQQFKIQPVAPEPVIRLADLQGVEWTLYEGDEVYHEVSNNQYMLMGSLPNGSVLAWGPIHKLVYELNPDALRRYHPVMTKRKDGVPVRDFPSVHNLPARRKADAEAK